MFRALVHTTPPRRRAPPHTRSVSTVRVPKWIRPVPCLQRLVVIPSRSRRWRRGSAGRVVGDFDDLVDEAMRRPVSGGDFRFPRGRLVEEPLPWSYADRAGELTSGARGPVLDLGTGGGGFLTTSAPTAARLPRHRGSAARRARRPARTGVPGPGNGRSKSRARRPGRRPGTPGQGPAPLHRRRRAGVPSAHDPLAGAPVRSRRPSWDVASTAHRHGGGESADLYGAPLSRGGRREPIPRPAGSAPGQCSVVSRSWTEATARTSSQAASTSSTPIASSPGSRVEE